MHTELNGFCWLEDIHVLSGCHNNRSFDGMREAMLSWDCGKLVRRLVWLIRHRGRRRWELSSLHHQAARAPFCIACFEAWWHAKRQR